MKTKNIFFLEWYNSFTKELDKYLLTKQNGIRTYLWGNTNGVNINQKNIIVFRVPGATRGHIKVDDDMVITEIVIDEDAYNSTTACYTKSVLKVIPKLVGTKLEVPKLNRIIVDSPCK